MQVCTNNHYMGRRLTYVTSNFSNDATKEVYMLQSTYGYTAVTLALVRLRQEGLLLVQSQFDVIK